MPRHPHVMGAQRPRRRHPLDLRDHQPAVVPDRNRLLKAAQIRPFMLISQVAPFIRRRRPQDADIGHDVREMQPYLAAKLHPRDDGGRRTAGVHRAAFAHRVGEGLKTHLGQHPRTPRRHVAVHVEQDARRHVIGRDAVFRDHLPDLRHRQVRRPRRIRPRDHPRQKSVLGDMVDALHAIHVAGRDRVDCGQPAWMPLAVEPLADGAQDAVGTAESRGGGDRDNRPVRDVGCGVVGGHEFGHLNVTGVTAGLFLLLERSKIIWNDPNLSRRFA